MASAVRKPAYMSADTFLAWDAPGPYLWQLIEGRATAMAPPSGPHGLIQAELCGLIREHLRAVRSPCRVGITPGVQPRFRSEQNVLVPDIGVTCSPDDMRGKVWREPLLLIEILSPSNRAEIWRNVGTYLSIRSLREVLVVRSDRIGADLLRLDADGQWPDDPVPVAGDTVTLESIGMTFSLPGLYGGTGVTRRVQNLSSPT